MQKKLKDMERPLHLTLQEGNQGGPSRPDIIFFWNETKALSFLLIKKKMVV
jgi:hypothetical protein